MKVKNPRITILDIAGILRYFSKNFNLHLGAFILADYKKRKRIVCLNTPKYKKAVVVVTTAEWT